MLNRKKRLILGFLAIICVVIGLGYWSYKQSYQRVYGAFAPFALDIQVWDGQGVPLSSAKASISNFPSFFLITKPELSAADGRLLLAHSPQGIEWEFEERRLFWLIRMSDGQPPSLYAGFVEISAPGYTTVHIPVAEALKQSAGTITLPETNTQLPRYLLEVTLEK